MKRNISIQLYTVRESLEKDFSGTLRKLADIGYRWVESYGNFFGGLSAENFLEFVSSLNIKVSSSHADIKLLRGKLPEIISYNKAIGCGNIVCARADFSSEQETLEIAEYFNEVGEACRKAGIAFAYHNHDHEFARYSGKYIMDILLEKTDPALMGLELDVYWAARAGVDPAAYQEKWKDRSILIHCKDMDNSPEKNFAEVGKGVLNFPEIINAASKAEWFVVEQDKSDDPFRSVEISYKNLEKLLGV
jgi:sugar phosphate isomerase/epimerase